MISFMASASLANIAETIGVSTVPGHTALMRMPREAYSSAALLVSPSTPCLAAWYTARPGRPINPPIDAALTTASAIGDYVVTPSGLTSDNYTIGFHAGTLTVGKYYLQGGKVRYKSSRSEGTVVISEDKGKTTMILAPEGSFNPVTGPATYERVK